jgi:predicted RNase H-like nuclease (RuvC/YqgF family)
MPVSLKKKQKKMNNKFQNPKTIAAIVTGLLIISLAALVFTYELSENLEAGWNSEKLKSEKILAEKLSLDKEIVKLKQSIFSLQGKNTDLDKTLSAISSKLAIKESEVKKMQKENATLKEYKQQVAEIQKIRGDLEHQIATLTSSLNSSNREKDLLNKTVADLQQKNKLLSDEMKQMQLASLDDIRVEAFNKNKLTVSAKKTKKLDVNFLIPANHSSDKMQFKITDPSGRLLTPMDGAISLVEAEEAPIFTADNTAMTYLKQTKQVKMEYAPKKKLKPGVYRIEVLNSDNVYMGSLQVRLK